jgi:hypothetical protein
MPATMARDAMIAAWASRFRPRVNSSGVAEAATCAPHLAAITAIRTRQAISAALQPGDRAEGQPDQHRPDRADGQQEDVGRVQVLGMVQIEEPDDGEDGGQHDEPPARDRLADQLLVDDEADDSDDDEDFQQGHCTRSLITLSGGLTLKLDD